MLCFQRGWTSSGSRVSNTPFQPIPELKGFNESAAMIARGSADSLAATPTSPTGGPDETDGPAKRVTDLMQVTKLVTVFETYTNEEAALRSLRQEEVGRPARAVAEPVASSLPGY